MIPFRGGIRRVLLVALVFVCFLAFFYESVYLSSPHLIIRDSSLLSPKNSLSIQKRTAIVITHQPNNKGQVKSPDLRTHNVTLGSIVTKKLDIIYEHINVSRTNDSRSIFPAYQIGEYLMLNPKICTDATIVDVIIIVHTAPGNFWKRREMRATFANRTLFLPKQIRIAFLLGKPKDPSLEEELVFEHKSYNDTIMGDFYDDYHNLTLKGVMGYHWVGEYCPNARVVLKIDDDVVIDMYSLLSRHLPHIEGKQKSIFCNTWRKNMGILRGGKWEVPHRYFTGLKHFPYIYCSGFTVLLTTDLMKPLYEAAKVTPFFWIDDLFLFGILPKVVGGITYYNYQLNEILNLGSQRTLECFKKEGADCRALSTLIHGHNSRGVWNAIQGLRNETVQKWQVPSYYEE